MWRLADRHIDEFIADGQCEFLAAYARPFSLLVVADLLGVPEEDREEFRSAFGPTDRLTDRRIRPRADRHESAGVGRRKVQFLHRGSRREPRDDVLSALATAKYPDGSTREVIDVVRTATFLSAPARKRRQNCSARRCVLAIGPTSSKQLREDRSRIPTFIEECLRLDSPVKASFGWHARPPNWRGGRGCAWAASTNAAVASTFTLRAQLASR